jgi:hypothetical protein
LSLHHSQQQQRARKNQRHCREEDVRMRAHRALNFIRERSPALLASRVTYQKCKEGVAVFEALRARVKPPLESDSQTYKSLAGQQAAQQIANATLDDVLTVLIEETSEGKWRCDVVLDFGALGSPVGEAVETREEAQQVALAILSMLGRESKPAEGYEPVDGPENKLQIRLNGHSHVVSSMPDEWVHRAVVAGTDRFSCSAESLLAELANCLLQSEEMPDSMKEGILILLANCGWSHVSQEVLDDFCIANAIELTMAPASCDHGPSSHPTIH